MTDEVDWDAIEIAALELLEGGPLQLSRMTELLDAGGFLQELREMGFDGEELEEAVEECIVVTDDLWVGPNRTLVLTSQLLDGMVMTHRLTSEEISSEEVPETPDLVVLDFGLVGDLVIEGGGELRHIPGVPRPGEDSSTFAGPEGWLKGFSAGDVMAFTRLGGSVRIEAAHQIGEGEQEIELLRQGVEHRIPEGQGEESFPVVMDALTLDLSAFRHPVRPLAELLRSAGLEHRGFTYGRAGENWESFGESSRKSARLRLLANWGITECCQEAFDAAWDSYSAFLEDIPPRIKDTAAHLSHGLVAPALADYVLKLRLNEKDDLAGFATQLLTAGDKPAAAARLILGVLAQNDDHTEEAERMFRLARRGDPGYGPAAVRLAEYELHRGKVDEAIALLQHPEIDAENPTRQFLEDFRSRSRATFRGVGRNDPCPCGSGRKYKVCCQDGSNLPLSVRTELLMHKLLRYASDDDGRTHVEHLAYVAADAGGLGHEAALDDLMVDPLLWDFALWEGEMAAKYLDVMGDLLPVDEQAMVASVAASSRQLLEIIEVDPGRSLTLRDTSSGDIVWVQERSGSMDRHPGEYLLGRVTRLVDPAQILGAVMTVPLRLRNSALALVDDEPDDEDLAEWYGRAMAPPQLANREGEPTVLIEMELELADDLSDQEVCDALDAVLERSDGDGESAMAWSDIFDISEEERIVRGWVRYVDGKLLLDTNSEVRSQSLLTAVRGALPGLRVKKEVRTDPRKAFLAGRAEDGVSGRSALAAGTGPGGNGEILAEFMRQKEREWVDEPVPALAGLTPRQALNDPTRREDLLALLREFEEQESRMDDAGGMQTFKVERIRGLLGL
jgi:tetratricopeptide (TPR) repeat protein